MLKILCVKNLKMSKQIIERNFKCSKNCAKLLNPYRHIIRDNIVQKNTKATKRLKEKFIYSILSISRLLTFFKGFKTHFPFLKIYLLSSWDRCIYMCVCMCVCVYLSKKL